jgi:hypothetical protein
MKLGSFFPLNFRRGLLGRILFLTLVTSSCGLQATAQSPANGSESSTAGGPNTYSAPPQNPGEQLQSPTAASISTPSTPSPTATAETVSTPQTQAADKQTWPNFEKAFEAGVANYQAKKYDEARLAFSQALEKDPANVQALTNLALVQFQLGKKPWAVALLRKAQALKPDFSTPKTSLEFILPQLDVKEIPHEIQMWESIRSSFIVPFTLNGYLGLTALCLFATGWLWLQYIGQRREAFRDEKSLPPFPLIPTLITVIFIGVLSLTLMKVIDQGIPRATIVNDKVTVFSAPNEQSVALFDLFGGLEVVLGQQNADWVQVTYPGALTGWVPKSSLFQTSGRPAW